MEESRWIRVTERGIFTFLNLLLVMILLASCLSYPYRARLAPLAIGIPTAFFLLIQGLFDWFPPFEKRFRSLGDASLFTTELPMTSSEAEGGPLSLQRRELALLLWVSGLVLATYLLGILVAMPLFAFAYLRLWSGDRWSLVVSYSLGTWLAVYLLLVKLLEAQLPVGLLFEWLGG
jgi:hypothetical protein